VSVDLRTPDTKLLVATHKVTRDLTRRYDISSWPHQDGKRQVFRAHHYHIVNAVAFHLLWGVCHYIRLYILVRALRANGCSEHSISAGK
jgi:hypothetical protein